MGASSASVRRRVLPWLLDFRVVKWVAVWFGIVAVAGAAWVVFPTEEKRILSRLESLAEAASLEPDESPVARAVRGARIGAYFTEQARINLGAPFRAVQGRDALIGFLSALRVPDHEITVTFVDATVSFDRRLLIANGRLTALATSRSSAGEEIYCSRPLDVALRRIDGDWLVDDLRTIDPAEWKTP